MARLPSLLAVVHGSLVSRQPSEGQPAITARRRGRSLLALPVPTTPPLLAWKDSAARMDAGCSTERKPTAHPAFMLTQSRTIIMHGETNYHVAARPSGILSWFA
ncbi:hypothetical protein Dimus_022816, partial [Dionaea muscipula]